MIIPVQPVPVRVSVSTEGINHNGYVVPDLDIEKLIRESDSNLYELNICYATANLYRTNVYQVNKTAKSITFFFMVGNDLYSAALTVSNGRCTFKKIPFGDTLPTVTSAYEGYVLTVDSSGEWVAAPPAGGSAFIVNVQTVGTANVFDVTAGELYSAIQSGSTILFYQDDNIYTLYKASYSENVTVKYNFVTTLGTGSVFKANTADDYPRYSR